MVKEKEVPVPFHKIREKPTVPVIGLSLFPHLLRQSKSVCTQRIEAVVFQISVRETGSSDFLLGFLEALENLC